MDDAPLPQSSLAEAAPEGQPAVVLVHFGEPGLIRRCLASLASLEPEPHQVVVVDHGPGKDLPAVLAGVHPRCTILPNPANPGFGAGCNQGAAHAFGAGAEAVWFLNPDAYLEAPTLGKLMRLAREHPGVALWGTQQRDGARILGADLQAPWFTHGPGDHADGLPAGCWQLEQRETLSGASILVTRRHWDSLGPLPENLFLYLEDTAWCLRAHTLGLPMVLVEVPVVHSRSTITGRRSPLSIFYGVRNQLLLHRQIHPLDGAARLRMAVHLLQKRFFQGRWGLLRHTLRGIYAAAKGLEGRDPRY